MSIVKHFKEDGSVVLSEKQHSLKDWLEDVEFPAFQEHSGCVCDCEKNYGKGCLHPEKYLSGGCK